MNKIRLAVLLLFALVVATIAAGGLGARSNGPYASALSTVGIGVAEAKPYPTCNTYCATAGGVPTCKSHNGINQNCVLGGENGCSDEACP